MPYFSDIKIFDSFFSKPFEMEKILLAQRNSTRTESWCSRVPVVPVCISGEFYLTHLPMPLFLLLHCNWQTWTGARKSQKKEFGKKKNPIITYININHNIPLLVPISHRISIFLIYIRIIRH